MISKGEAYGLVYLEAMSRGCITIGSINISKEKLLNYTKGLLTFPKEIKINNLGLYKIEGDSHQLLKKIYF